MYKRQGLSLGTLFVGCQLLDFIWPVLVLTGVERVSVDHTATAFMPFDFEHYPWSHSLGMTLVWSLIAFIIIKQLTKDLRAALSMALVVSSHWVLDFLTHRPDVPLWFTGPKLGLGLWNSVPATVITELVLFGAGIALYLSVAKGTGPKAAAILWSLVAFLLIAYLGSGFGPKPAVGTPPAAIAGPALAMWLIVAWGYWADRHRSVQQTQTP